MPSHDPSLLPHQVAADQLDHYFPRASATPAPLGEDDEVEDPDCLEPRTVVIQSHRSDAKEAVSRLASDSKSVDCKPARRSTTAATPAPRQAHMCDAEDVPLFSIHCKPGGFGSLRADELR